MQSNTKQKFEHFRGQGTGRMANQDRFNKMIKNEGDEYGIEQRITSIQLIP